VSPECGTWRILTESSAFWCVRILPIAGSREPTPEKQGSDAVGWFVACSSAFRRCETAPRLKAELRASRYEPRSLLLDRRRLDRVVDGLDSVVGGVLEVLVLGFGGERLQGRHGWLGPVAKAPQAVNGSGDQVGVAVSQQGRQVAHQGLSLFAQQVNR